MYGQTTHMHKTLVEAYHTVLLRMREKNLVLPMAMIFALCGGAMLQTGKARAASLTWDTTSAADGTITDGAGTWTDGGGNWNDGATSVGVNWNSTTPDQAVFSGTSGGTITLAAGGVTANALTFNGTANYTLSGGALTLGGAAPAITVASGRNATINSVIAGNASLTKAGAGTLTITGVNTFSGGTSVDAGMLTFGNGSLGTGPITMNGGTLQWYFSGYSILPYAANTQDVSSQIVMVAGKTATFDTNTGGGNKIFASGIGNGTNAALVVTGSGTLVLKGTNTYTGDTTLAGAFLNIEGSGSLNAGSYAGNITISSGKVFNYSSSADQLFSGTIDGSGTLQAIGGSGNLTISGAIGGSVWVMQNSAGTIMTLTGTSTSTGTTSVGSGATLRIGNGGTSGTLGSGNVSIGGTLAFNRSDAVTLSNILSGGTSGTVMQMGSGITTLSGASTYAGVTSVSAGTLRAGIASVAGTNGAFGLNSLISMANAADATLDLNNYNTQTGSLSGGGAGGGNITLGSATLTIGVDNGTQTYAGSISGSGSLVKKGTGTQTLSGVNTYTGATTVSTGTLNITGSLASAISVASGAVLSGQGGVTSSDLALGAGSSIKGVAGSAGAGTAFRAVGAVTAGASVAIFGADNNPALGSHTLDVVGYGSALGATPGAANFSTANYRSAVVADDTANKKITLNYTNAVDVWNSASATWNTMSTAAWRNGLDQKFSSGDNVLFDDTGAGAGTTITVTLASAMMPGNVVFNNTVTSYTLSGAPLSGATAITKNGAGTVFLSSANNYTGGTTINAGTLTLNNTTQALGTGSVVNNGSLVFSCYSTATPVSNVISGTGSVTQSYSSTLTLTGNNTYSGGTTITSGTISFASGALSTGAINLNGGALQWNGSNTQDVSAQIRILNSGSVDTNGNNVTFASAIGSPLTSLVLTNINTVTIPEVTGYWTTNLYLGKTGMGTLTLSGAADNPNLNLTTLGGKVVLAKASSSAVHAASGYVSIAASSTLQLAGTGDDQIGDASTVSAATGSVFDFNGRNETLANITGSGSVLNSVAGTTSTVTLGVGDTSGVIQNGTGTMAVAKTGTGTQKLSGASSYTGPTAVLGGILKAGVATVGGATPTSGAFGVNSAMTIASGTTLDMGGFNQTIGSLTGAGAVMSSSAASTLTVGGDNTSTVFSGMLQDPGVSLASTSMVSLTKIGTGTLVLAGNNAACTGTITLAGGTLQVGLGGVAGTLGSGNVVNNAALVFNRADAAYVVSSVISGIGSVQQAGPGTLTLTRANTYTGTTSVGNGILHLDFSASGAPATNILSASSPLALSGGRLKITGKAGQNGIIQTFNGTTSGGAGGALELVQNGATTADVSLGALTIGAPINFVGGTGTAAGARFMTASSAGANDGTTKLSNGSLWNGAVWASILNSGGVNYVVQWNGTYTDVYTGGGSVMIPNAPAADVRIVEGGTGANTLAASATTINSLLMSAGTTASVVQMGGQTLIVNGTGVAGNIALAGAAKALTLGSAANEGFLTAGASGASTLTLVDGNANANLTVNAVIQNNAGAGPVSVVISGGGAGGRVVFGGANTYTGTTAVSDGTLQLNDGATPGSGVVINNGNVAFNFTGPATVSYVIGGSGALQNIGGGVTTLIGNNTYAGTTTIAAGTLQVGAGGTSGSLGSGAVTDNATLAFNRSGTSTVSGAISGTGVLVQQAGTLVLAGNNTYAGGTTINAGATVQLGNGGASGTLGVNSGFDPYGTGSILPGVNSGTITNNGTLVFNRSDASLVVDMPITGTGSVRQAGTGTTTLTGGHVNRFANNTYSGGTVVSSGSLILKFAGVAGSGTITVGDAQTGGNSASLFIRDSTYNNIVVSSQGTGVATVGALSDSGLVSSSSLPPLPFYGTLTLNRATTLSSANYYGVQFKGVISGNVGTLTLDGGYTLSSSSLGHSITLAASVPGQTNTFVGDVVVTGIGTSVLLGESGGGFAGNFIPDASNVHLSTGTEIALVGNETINALTGLGSVLGAASTGTWANLTIGANNGSGVFGGSIGSDAAATDLIALEAQYPGIVAKLSYSELRPLIRPTTSTDSARLNIIKVGTGTQTFAGQSMYDGYTTVLAGTLKAGTGFGVLLQALGSGGIGTFFPYGSFGSGYSGYMSVAAGATLDLNGSSQQVGSLANYAGTGGLVTSSSPGVLVLFVGGNNSAPSSTTSFGGVIENGTGIVYLKKIGVGTQTLTGANTYTGATMVTSDVTSGNPGVGTGTLALDFSAAGAPAANIISSASTLVLSGGILKITGKAGQNGIVQTFNGFSTGSTTPVTFTVLNANHPVSDGNGGTVIPPVGAIYPLTRGPGGTIQLVQNGATTLDVDLGSLDLTGPVNFVGGTGIVPGARFITSSSAGANDARTQLAGGALWNGSDWASIEDSGGVHYIVQWRNGTDYTNVYTGTAGGSVVIPNTASADIRLLDGGLVGAPNTLAASTTTIHSFLVSAAVAPAPFRTSATSIDDPAAVIKMNANSVNDTLVVGDGASASGAIAMAESARALTIGQSSGQGFLTSGTSGASTLGLTNANVATILTVNSVIKDNAGGGAVGLTTAGPGTTQLLGANTYTGTTTIGSGTLQIGNAGTTGTFGAGSVIDNGVLSVNRTDAVTVSNAISGSGSLSQKGTGALTLTGANTYAGTTTIAAATRLNIGNGGATGAIGSGNVVNGGTLTFNSTGTILVAGGISGSGLIQQLGTGTTILAGTGTSSNNTGGVTTISAGTLQVGNGSTTGSLGAEAVTNNGTLAFNRSDLMTVSNAITGSGKVNQIGTGTTLLTGTNTYSGTTTISAGTLQVGSAASPYAGTLGSGNVVDNGILAFGITNTGSYSFISNVISGTGALVNTGSIVLTGANTYAGTTTISNGTLRVGNGGTAGSIGAGTVANNGILAFNRTDAVVLSNAISGTGELQQTGTGSLTLTGVNTYTGNTTVGAGTLSIGNGGTSGTPGSGTLYVNNTGVLIFNHSDTLTVGYVNTNSYGSGTVQQNGTGTTIFSGIYTSGTTTFTGSFASYNTTIINAGTLQVGTGGTGGTLGIGAVTNNATLVFNRSNALTVSSIISGTGAVKQIGAGTLTLTGANTYTGQTSANAGTLKLDFSASGAPTSNIISASSALNLGGGNVVIQGKSAATNTQAFNGLAVNANSTLQLVQNGATSLDVNLGTITLNTGTLNFVGATGTVAGARFITTSSAGANDGTTQLAGNSLWNGITWASIQNSGGIKYVVQWQGAASNVYTGTDSGTVVVPNTPTADVVVLEGGATGAPNTLAAATTTIHSLLMSAATTAATLRMDANSAGDTLVVGDGDGASGAIMVASTAQSATLGQFSGQGFLTAGSSGASTLRLINAGATSFLTVNSAIQNNAGAGAVALVVIGPGTTVLAGNNTYAGTTTVASGTLQIGSGGASGTLGAGNVANNGTLAFNRSDAAAISQTISGSGGVSQAGAGVTTLAGANTYTGATTISSGTLKAGVATVGGNNPTSGAFGMNSALTVGATGILDLNGFNQTLGSLAGSIGGIVTNSAATAMALTLGGNNASSSFAGMIQDGVAAVSLVKIGTGTQILAGNNIYTGATTVGSGTLQIGAGGTTGTLGFGTVIDNGTLVFNRSDVAVVSSVIGGTGNLSTLGTGTIVLTGANTYAGTTTLGGTLQIGNGSTTGTLGFGAVTNDYYTLIFNRSDGLVVSNAIGGISGQVKQQGNGVITLSGANTYRGATTISAGTLKAGVATVGGTSPTSGAFGVNSAMKVFASATLDLNGFDQTLGSLVDNAGSGGRVTNSSSTALTLTVGGGSFAGLIEDGSGKVSLKTSGGLLLAGPNTYTGATTISGATVTAGVATIGGENPISGAFGVNSAMAVFGYTTLNLNGLDQTIGSLADNAGSGGTVTNNAVAALTLTMGGNNASTSFAGVIQNGIGMISLVKIGGGTQTLGGANTYTGSTTVRAGTLRAGAATWANQTKGAFGLGSAVRVGAAGTLDLNGFNQTIGSLADDAGAGGMVTNASATALTLTTGGNDASTTFSGMIQNGTGTVSLTKMGSGTQTLAGNNTYTGTTTVSAGVLQIGNGGASGTLGFGSVLNNAELVFNRSAAATVVNSISGTGKVSQIGSGTTTFTSSHLNTYTGNTVVNAGALKLAFDAGMPAANIVSTSSTLVMGGGTLIIQGQAGQSDTQSFNGVTVNANSTLQLVQNGATSLEVNLGALHFNAGSLNFVGATGTAVGARFVTTSSAGANDGIAKLANGSLWNGTDWASIQNVGGTNYIVKCLFNYTDIYTGAGGGTGMVPNTAVANIRILDGGVGANTLAAATTTINSLLMSAGTTAATLKMDANSVGDTLVVGNGPDASGSMAVASDAQSLTIGQSAEQGFLTAGSSGASTLNLINANANVSTASLVALNSVINTNAGVSISSVLTINSVIKNNAGAGVVSLVVTGPGTTILLGTNTYSGTTTINSGTLQVGSGGTSGKLGSGAVTNNAALEFNRSDAVAVSNAIGGSGVVNFTGSGTTTLLGTNTYSGTTTISAGTLQVGDGTAGGTLGFGDVTDNAALTFNRTDAMTISAVIGGSGVVNQIGTGITTLTGTNTYSGATIISAGTLQVGNGTAVGTLGAGDVTDNGTLAFSRSDAIIVSQVVSGTGALVQLGTGTTTLTGANTYSGATTIGAGTLQVGNGTAVGTLGVGDVTNNGTLAFNRSDTITVSQIISGSGALTQLGTGTIILTGTNTYAGTTNITVGTLQVGSGGTSGTLGAGDVINNTALTFNRSDALTVSSGVSGTGTLTQLGSGTLILTGASNYAGITTISAGTLQIGNGGTTGKLGAGNVVNNGILAFNRSNTPTFSNAVSGSGSVVQAGAGTVFMTGNNTYAGTTTVSAGTLRIGSGGTSGTLGLGNVIDNAALEFQRSDAVTVSQAISGTGTLAQLGAGTTILAGANTYAGTTTVGSGTLQVGNAGTLGKLGTGNVVDNAVLAFNRTDSVTVSNAISGAGSVRNTGTGTTILSGANTYTGTTQVLAGILRAGVASTAFGNNSAVTVNSTLNLAGFSQTFGSLAGSGTIVGGTGSAATLTLGGNNTSATLTGNIQNGTTVVSVVKVGSGTQSFAGTSNTYTGTTLISAGTLQIGSGGTTGSIGSGLITNNATLAFNRSNQLTVSNAITGSGAVTKLAAGITRLTGANSYAGATTVSAGTLMIGDGDIGSGTTGTLGDGAVTVASGAYLIFNRSNALSVSNAIGGAGFVKQFVSNTTTLTGTNTYTGATTIKAGTLQIGNGGTSGTLGTGNVNMTAAANAATLAFNRSDIVSISNVIGGSGQIAQIGAGTTILAGANTYSGPTTISAGTLQVGGGGTAGTLGTSNVVDNANLAFNRSDTLVVSNAISGSGALTQVGAGTTRLIGATTYTGATSVAVGTLMFDRASASLTGSVTVASGATLAVGNTSGAANSAVLALANALNNGTLSVKSDGKLNLSGALTGTGTLTSSGSVSLASGSSVSNASTYNSGSFLNATGSVTTGALSFGNGSTLVLASGNTLITATGAVTVTLGAQIAATSATGFTAGTMKKVVATTATPTGLFTVNTALSASAGTGYHWNSQTLADGIWLGTQLNAPLLAAGSSQQTATLSAVGNAGAAIAVDPDIQANIAYLAGLSGAALQAALDSQSGHDRAAQDAVLNQHAMALGQGLQHFAGASLGAEGGAQANAAGDALRATALAGVQSGKVQEDGDLQFFVQAAHGSESRSAQSNGVLRSSATGNTFTVGVVDQISDSWNLGVAFTHDMTDIKSGGGLGKSENKTYGLDLFASHTLDDAKRLYVAGDFGFGVNRGENKRYGVTAANLTATSNTSGVSMHASAELGYKADVWQDAVLTPYAGLSFVRNSADASQESLPGAQGMALGYAANTEQSLESVIGASLAQGFKLGNGWLLTPSVGAAWHHQLEDNNNGTVATHFAGSAATSFNTNLGAIANDALELNAGVSVQLTSHLSASVTAKTYQSMDSDAKGHQNSLGASLKYDF